MSKKQPNPAPPASVNTLQSRVAHALERKEYQLARGLLTEQSAALDVVALRNARQMLMVDRLIQESE